MTLPRLDAIVAHWEVVPPLAVSVAAIASVLGVGRSSTKAPAKKSGAGAAKEVQDAQALIDLLGGAGFSTEKPAWLRAETTTT